jgi:hypothetical protein
MDAPGNAVHQALPREAQMPVKVKSYYCEVCGRQSKFTKETRKHGSKMMSRAADDLNPLAAATGGMFKLGGAAVNAAKSYRCVTCGSKKGAQAPVA